MKIADCRDDGVAVCRALGTNSFGLLPVPTAPSNAHLSLGRSGTPLRGGGVLFRHAASLSGMSQLTACAISTSQGTRSGSGRGMRPSANTLASSMRFWGKVQGAGRSPALVGQPSPLGLALEVEQGRGDLLLP